MKKILKTDFLILNIKSILIKLDYIKDNLLKY